MFEIQIYIYISVSVSSFWLPGANFFLSWKTIKNTLIARKKHQNEMIGNKIKIHANYNNSVFLDTLIARKEHQKEIIGNKLKIYINYNNNVFSTYFILSLAYLFYLGNEKPFALVFF